MKIVVGAITGALFALLFFVRICLRPIGDDIFLGLTCLVTAPTIGAVIGAFCFHRIGWGRKSVVFTTRCAVMGALLFGIANLLFQIDADCRSSLTDFTNSLARFLFGAAAGGSVGVCIGRILFRHADIEAAQITGHGNRQPNDEVWPPPIDREH